ncbi:MAG: hypothetical protein PVH18_04335 [Chloroflexota bacterium]|jgi:hypothetical protein
MRREAIIAVIYLTIVLFIGYFVSTQVSAFLGISINPKELPQVETPIARPADEALPELAPYTAIVLPSGALADERFRRAAEELAGAVEYRTGQRPQIVAGPQDGPVGPVIVVESPDASGLEAESYRIQSQGQDGSLTIRAGDALGSVYGLYALAGQLKSGAAELAGGEVDLTVAPEMRYRFVGMGGVGIVPDEALWRAHDYSHNSRAFERVVLAESPYIDQAEMDRVNQQFQEYIQRMISFGYNGIIFDGFLEYVDFAKIGDGYQVYGPESEYRARHAALREAFGEMLRYADEMGMQVIFKTDMLAFSDPLADYIDRELGGVDTSDPALWEIYRLGLAELFESFPFADGLMIRIGEAGAVFALEGWDYYSSLDVRTDEAVQTMLWEFSDVAAAYDKTIYFRSWSVGVGEVGNMHTVPETYERILGDVEADNLVVSTKYTMGDYYSYLPLNPTLAAGDQPRIVEFQARREFEAFNAFPNYLGPLHQAILQEFEATNPNIEGVWVWTQGGGPPRAGPWSIYPFHGFWQTYDDNVFVTAQLAWDPDIDIQDLTEQWIRLTLSDDPETVHNLAQMSYLSHEAVLEGLYIGEFARSQILAMGLEPPPQFWIFEWDIVSGSSAALSAVYEPLAGKVKTAVAEGFAAVELVEQMMELVRASDRATFYEPEVHGKLLQALVYERNLFETLAWYRAAVINYYHWLATGDGRSLENWREALAHFQVLKTEHVSAYGENLDFPAYNFFAAEAGIAHARPSLLMTWLARLLLLLMVLTFVPGASAVQKRLPDFPGKRGLRALWLALTSPWNLALARPGGRWDMLAVSLWPVLLILAGRLVFSSFVSPAYLLLVVLLLAPFYLVLLALKRNQPRFPLWAAIGGPMLLMTALPLVMTAVRGPLFYWYQFWMGPEVRTLYITLGAGASAWTLFVLFVAQRAVYGCSGLAAVGSLLLALGSPLVVLGLFIMPFGLEQALTTINDQMAVLPLGLSRILGITTYLEIPTALPQYLVALGLLLAAGGLLLALVSRKRKQDADF